MKLITEILKMIKISSTKQNKNRKEAFIKQGTEQFRKLIEKGLGVPIVLL